MRPKRRYALLALVGALALCAGCQSMLTEGGQATETVGEGTATPTETEVTETEVTETEAMATEAPPAFPDRHERALREAGSVTVERTLVRTVRADGRNVTETQSRTTRIEFESGRAFTRREPLAGTPTEVYRNESGAAFSKLGARGTVHYFGPERSDGVDATTRISHLPVDPTALSREGTGTVDGVTGTVYTAGSTAALGSGAYESLASLNVTAFELAVVVGDAGHVEYRRLDLTVVDGGDRLTITERKRFTGVGSTTVEEPAWLPEAKAVAARPDHDDVVTERFNETGADGEVEMAVTGPHGEVTGPGSVGPTISENPMYRNEFLDGVRAGEIARYYYPEDAARNVTIRVHYDDGAVADENESGLRLAVANESGALLEPVNSTVDEANDTVSATLTDEPNLEHYQGKTVLALDWRRYVTRLAG